MNDVEYQSVNYSGVGTHNTNDRHDFNYFLVIVLSELKRAFLKQKSTGNTLVITPNSELRLYTELSLTCF